MGELDERAFERAMDEDLDEALTLLAELTGATDERLRELGATEYASRCLESAKRYFAENELG